MTFPAPAPRSSSDNRKTPSGDTFPVASPAFRWRRRLANDSLLRWAAALGLIVSTAAVIGTAVGLSKLLLLVPVPAVVWAAARLARLWPGAAEATDPRMLPVRGQEDRAFVERYWLDPRNRQAMRGFILAFDRAEFALRGAVVASLGSFGRAMPLPEAVSYSVESGIWSTADLAFWQDCLGVHQEILLHRHTPLAAAALVRLSARLEDLAARTQR